MRKIRMKISIQIVLFLIFLNAGAVMLDEAGVNDALGIEPAVGGSERLENVQEDTQKFSTGTGLGETLFGMYTTLGRTVETVVELVTAGPTMLKNAGVPAFFVDYVFAGLLIIPVLDVVSFLRGLDLV